MSKREEPDLDHVREAMREHDERQEQEPPPEEPDEAPAPADDEED
jgi:hypothetical protein